MKKIMGVVCALLLEAAGASAQTAAPKIFVSVDMEGIWGVVHGDQTAPGSAEYATARRWMADDVNAVIAGLREAGAGEIVVNDSHGSMRNILADALDPRASLISGSPKPLTMMQGIDPTFAAVVFVGYHARAGSTPAILDHTISGGVVHAFRVNGRELPEMGINAAIAAAYKVPVIMLSGDAETCKQARELFGESFVTVPVKEAIGRVAARLLPMEEARRRLKDGARQALLRRDTAQVYRLNGPFMFEIEFTNSGQAERPLLVPNVKRTGPRAVSFTTDDYIEGFELARAVIALASS